MELPRVHDSWLAKNKIELGVIDSAAMKTQKKVKAQLEALKPLLKERFEVETIGFFGSYSRGGQTKKSDVDVLVVFSKDARVGFFKFLELEEFLSRKLGVRVDLVTMDALKPMLKERILKETVYA
jgi:predicted nucleotidyltransferase